MTVLLICAVGVLNILCFLVGERAGRRIGGAGNEKKVVPEEEKVSFSDQLRNKLVSHERAKEVRLEEERQRKIWANMENYDGTDHGQKDV